MLEFESKNQAEDTVSNEYKEEAHEEDCNYSQSNVRNRPDRSKASADVAFHEGELLLVE